MASVDDFFNSKAKLPSLPKVVQEVMQMLESEGLTINELAQSVERDAAISAQVLKLANSSYYGVTRAIKTIDDAIAILGLSNLRTLVIASGVTGSFANIVGLDLRKFWRHSLVTAYVSRELAKAFVKDAEVAYIVGLLHNIGGLLMHMAFPQVSVEVDALCHGWAAEMRQEVELAKFGLDHCQLAEEVANRWSFPSEISRSLRYYATPLDKQAGDIAAIVYVAAHIASCLERGEVAENIVESLNAEVAKALQVNAEWIARIESYRGLVKEVEAFI
jgi:HD-like signal output (HDOD) protein